MTANRAICLEKKNGWEVGRDPRRMNRDELIAAGHAPMSPLKALRLHCIDCCANQPSEVRLCTAVKCPSWPFRMRVNPWRKEPTEAQREARRQSGIRLAGKARNSISLTVVAPEPEPTATRLTADASVEENSISQQVFASLPATGKEDVR